MKKQTIVWTALPHRSFGANAAGTKLRLSALVAPRLWNDDPKVKKMKLGDFPDFLNWPQTLIGSTFGVSFNGGPPLPATVVTTPARREDVWQALFDAETTVVPFAFQNMTGVAIDSFPADTLHGAIRDIYVKAATDPAFGGGRDLPPREVLATDPDLVDLAEEIPPRPDYVPVPTDERPSFVGTPGPEPDRPMPRPAPGGPEPEGEPGGPGGGCSGCAGCLGLPLALLRRFLKWLGFMALLPFVMGGIGGGMPPRRDEEGPASQEGPISAKRSAVDQLHAYVKATDKSEPLPADFAEMYDFHQMVSTLGDYPILMRYCGLVLDLEVELTAPLPANGTVTLAPNVTLSDARPPYTPRTHYEIADDKFIARPAPVSDLRDGLLRVDDPSRFQVLQLDVAGSTLKLRSMVNKLVNEERFKTVPANEPKKQGLPSLQTAGISIVRPKLAEKLKETLLASWAANAALAAVDGSPITAAVGGNPLPKNFFFADDLVRGYRVDVFDDQSNRWHSLCQRVGTYDFTEAGLTLAGERDEGFVQMSVTEPLKEETPRRVKLHESLFTWNGWSLGAPRYGKTILSPKTPPPNTPPDPDDPTQVGAPKNDAVTQFKMESRFTPEPKSLPRLRFGYTYRLRVRAVDLAGNSVFAPGEAAFDATQAEVTPEVKYRRFEPIAPPMVMLRSKPIEGESLERVVVRSRFDDPAASIEAQTSERHLVPPKTSQLMAEHHRRFDGPNAMDASLAAYVLAGSEAGSLMQRVHPGTGSREDIPGAIELTEGPHTYWMQTNDTFDLAYLPDPYARGVVILGLPGMSPPDAIIEPAGPIVNKIPFTGPWPNLKPIRLRVRGLAAGAAPAAPAWDATSLVLTVEVPQGETYEIEVRSYFKDTDLENMGVWKWVADRSLPQTVQLRAEAIAGRNWLHLPARTLVLVHATQQPLAIPEIRTITPTKALNDTVATLNGTFQLDAKSTGKVDIDASWDDPFDDPAKPTFVEATDVVHSAARLAEVRVEDPKNDAAPIKNLTHALGDTKYHRVRYTPVASTRFREYFPPSVTGNAKNLIRPTDTEAGVPTTVDILNSARPDPPKPLYIVPLFAWERTSGGTARTTRRLGAGLRVYMDRPWFSSGAGELLGVTIKPFAVPFGSDEAAVLWKYTSQWGMDPLWNASATFPLHESLFADPAEAPRTVTLAEVNQDVVVVGYAPQFDSDRNLWFCDLLLQPLTSYFPFARLALVRFQPKSVPLAEISPAVFSDFIQVVPHREVKYDLAALDTMGFVEIEVSGPAYVQNDSPFGSPVMIGRLERRTAASAGDELGWEPVASALLPPVDQKKEKTVWRGRVSTSLPRPAPIRMVVLEAEMYQADAPSTDPLQILKDLQLPGIAGNDGASPRAPIGYRVTFADAVEVA